MATAPSTLADPRKPGGRYYDASLGCEYEVLAIDSARPGGTCVMTVRIAGEAMPATTSAAWDPEKDTVVAQPPAP